MKNLLKYFEVARTNLRSRYTYIWEQILSSVYLVFIMFVFVQLWKVTYAAGGEAEIGGYTLPEMVWYLVCTEAIVLSLPRIHAILETEVKDGDLAVRLNKPYNYLLFHYSAYVGEGLMRLVTTLGVGGLTAYMLVGGFAFRWEAAPVLLLIYLVTQVLNFAYSATVGLLAFWVEDVSGPYFIFDRAKWILGGLLLPVEVYPDAARRLAEALPFRHMIAGPARLFVKFAWVDAVGLIGAQLPWAVVFGVICWSVFRLGVRRVDINGG